MSINLDIKQGFVSMGNHNMDYANAQESMNLFAHGRLLLMVTPMMRAMII